MTVIAWKDGFVVADRMACRGELKTINQKLFQLDTTSCVGIVGETDYCLEMIEWLKAGAHPETYPANQRTDKWVPVIVFRKGQPPMEYQQTPYPLPVLSPYMAWGSGAHFAFGAMWMGGTAHDAVAAASAHCPSCGFGYDEFALS